MINFNNKNNVALLLIILGAIVFFMFVMPAVDNNYYNNIKENFNASVTNNDENKIDKNKCSRDCCGLAQWPVPSEMLSNTIPPDELKNYIPSNFSCSQGNNIGGGCVCLTQKNSDFLNNHGNNSRITPN